MKKSYFISAENLKLMLIAIILAALILLIPFYIKAQPGMNQSTEMNDLPVTFNDTVLTKK